MLLDSTAGLEILLTAAKTTNDMPITGSLKDRFIGRETDVPIISKTNGTTAVVLSAAPPAAGGGDGSFMSRSLERLRIVNEDTASKTLKIRMNQSGTFTTTFKVTLAVDEVLTYDRHNGFNVLTSVGERKVTHA